MLLGWFRSYRVWRRERRARREARLLIGEARRILKRESERLGPSGSEAIRAAADSLTETLAEGTPEQLWFRLQQLDRAMDDQAAFARKSPAREYAESIAIAVFVALFLRAFVVEAFQIPSGSMIPTLQVGDHIFVNKFIYGLRIPFTNIKFGWSVRTPQRGEVIVFAHPREADKDLIKRVVAVEGDNVEVRDNIVYVNGVPVERRHVEGDCHYVDHDETTDRWDERPCEAYQETLGDRSFVTLNDPQSLGRSFRPQRVPRHSVFVLGDNRDNSSDSRFWGFVPYELVKGKAMFVWWSRGEPEGLRLGRLFHPVE